MKKLICILTIGLSLAIANGQTQTVQEEKSITTESHNNKGKVEHVEKNKVTSPVERHERMIERSDASVQIPLRYEVKPEIKSQVRTSEKSRVRISINEPRFHRFFTKGHYRFRSEPHGYLWWRAHYTRLMLIEGCWYFQDDGCWFPAYGYDPKCLYPSDDPICD